MINLRFHIVSIVAVFLALAIGMFAGSTLLDRATVDFLKGRQASLDARNSRLRTENDALRAGIEAQVPGVEAFDAQVMPELLPGTISERPVLIVASKGIDADVVRSMQDAVRLGGGSPLGIVWLDARVDLDQPDAAGKVAAALGVTATKDRTKQAVVAEIAKGLTASASPATPTPTTTIPTTTVPGLTEPDGTEPLVTEPVPEQSPVSEDASLDVLSRLVDADLIDWESPTEGEPGARTLPTEGLDLVMLSGEGSELRPGRIMVPLIRAVAARVPGVVVGEVRTPRTPIEAIEQENVPARGEFVDPIRRDSDLAALVITVDDVDEPFGRLAVVLALGALPGLTTGSYGMAPSANQPFPTQPG